MNIKEHHRKPLLTTLPDYSDILLKEVDGEMVLNTVKQQEIQHQSTNFHFLVEQPFIHPLLPF